MNTPGTWGHEFLCAQVGAGVARPISTQGESHEDAVPQDRPELALSDPILVGPSGSCPEEGQTWIVVNGEDGQR